MSALHTTAICEHGIDCASDKPGHALSFMRLVMGRAAAAKWVDASVVGFEGDWAELESWGGQERFSIWNHEDLRVELEVGEVVSLNVAYGLLAASERSISVAVISN